MVVLSEALGETLGLAEPSARFLLALLSAYPLALMYKFTVSHSSSNVQNMYFTVSGLGVLYYIYGFAVWHLLVDIVAVYLVLLVCGGSLFSVCLTWIISMGHLTGGYVWIIYMQQVHSISWTIPHCVLVLKLIGLSYNIYDGKKDPEKLTKEMKMLSIDKVPSFLDVSGFSLFYGSALVGPQTPFSRHLAFTEGRLFDRHKTPSSIPAGLQRLMTGIFFSILYSLLNQYFPITTLISDEFAMQWSPVKLLLVVICGKVALWRYISVWLIAEGSCIITGVSYGKTDSTGRVDWQALANIHIIKFETCITLEGVIESFNLNTNRWVAWYVFKRLKFLGSKTTSWVIAMVFVSVWHGVWPGYYINFSLEVVCVMAERTFIVFLRRLFGSSLSDMNLVLRIPLTLAAYLLKNAILMYPLTCFMLLRWDHCYKFMSSVYFYCHLVTMAWLLLYHFGLSSFVRSKPRTHVHTAKQQTKTE